MINDICSKTPGGWTNDTEQRTDVMFLWDEVNDKNIMKKVVINPKLENVYYVYGAIIWNTLRINVTKGNGIKLIKSDVYKKMTIRNINTVRKIHTLLTSMTD